MKTIEKFWNRIPVVIRAVFNGFVVQIIGFIALLTIVPLNMKYYTSVPWALIPLAGALWCYWNYFGGRGWPTSTSDVRKRYRRSNPIESRIRLKVAVVSLMFGLSLYGISILQYGLRAVPIETIGLINSFKDLPLITAIPLALMIALFVGVGEEMSYRGYMQYPIEKKYGPILGLTIPAFFFAISHGLDPERGIIFFLVSIGWGALAIITNSIKPGIVMHAIIDAVSFLWVIFDVDSIESLLSYSIIENGLTSGFTILAFVLVPIIITTIFLFRSLWNLRPQK